MPGPTDPPPKGPGTAGGGGDGDPDVSFHPNPPAAAAATKANESPTIANIMATLMQLTTIVSAFNTRIASIEARSPATSSDTTPATPTDRDTVSRGLFGTGTTTTPSVAARKRAQDGVIELGDSLISWSSRTQRNISHSPTESEVVAADDAVREAMYLRSLLSEIGPEYVQKEPTAIRCDSEGACKVSKNPVFRKRLKHMPLRHHYLRERCRAGDTALVWIRGTENPADMLTKSLSKGPFEKHRDNLMGRSQND